MDVNENKYEDKNISINIEKCRKYNSNIYTIDLKIKEIKYLKTAFAKNKFGKEIEIREKASEIAKNNNAILAINGDFYGFRRDGFVLRNGVKYNDTARIFGRDDALIIYEDGNFKMINERINNLDIEILQAKRENRNIYQVFSFGPSLIQKGKMVENKIKHIQDIMRIPRMAIGLIKPLHYKIVCVDGRMEESPGLLISELKEYLLSLGCIDAYNLDGGGSVTLYFEGKILNKLAADEERKISDIIYIGY